MFEPRTFLSIFVMFIKIKETARNVELDDTCKSFFYNCLFESQYNHPNFKYMHLCLKNNNFNFSDEYANFGVRMLVFFCNNDPTRTESYELSIQ